MDNLRTALLAAIGHHRGAVADQAQNRHLRRPALERSAAAGIFGPLRDARRVIRFAAPGVDQVGLRRVGGPHLVEGRLRHLAPVHPGAGRLDDQGTEQPLRQRTAVALAAGRGGETAEQVRPLAIETETAGEGSARRDRSEPQAGRRDRPGRVPHRLEAGHDEGQAAGSGPVSAPLGVEGRLLLALRPIFDLGGVPALPVERPARYGAGRVRAPVGLGRLAPRVADVRLAAEQVGHLHFENVAHRTAQHQRARTLAILQPDLAGLQASGSGLRPVLRLAGDRLRRRRTVQCGDVAAQGEDHSVGIERPEAVVDEQMIESHDVGVDDPGPRVRRHRDSRSGQRQSDGNAPKSPAVHDALRRVATPQP